MTHRKTIVAYFSASGTTASVAAEIAKAADADLFEIRPEKPYTAGDLDWTDRKSRSTAEMSDPATRPEISSSIEDFPSYGTVILGFPIWWGVEPRIIDTFLESHDFSGKAIIPFCTSGGSGIEKAEESLHAHCRNAQWRKGKLLRRSNAAAWAREIAH